jgi:hypothetical protein
MARIHELMTNLNSNTVKRQRFLMQNAALIQMAFLEYIHNFVPDYMPCEAALLHMKSIDTSAMMCESQSSTTTAMPLQRAHYITMCDQFREKNIFIGNESWGQLDHGAMMQLDKLIRNTTKVPNTASSHCTNAFNNPSSAFSSALSAPATQVIRVQKEPLAECMYSMHLCMSNNLQELYEFDSNILQYKHQISKVHILHKRLRISWLPLCIANEQRSALEQHYESCLIQQTSAKTLYVCTSCAIAGEQPLVSSL